MAAAERALAAILHCGTGAVLAGPTAAELDGLCGFESGRPHVLVPRGRRPRNGSGVVVAESRRLELAFVHRSEPRGGPGSSAAFSTWPRTLVATTMPVLCWQRESSSVLTTVDRLADTLGRLPTLPRRELMREVLTDIAAGSHSVPERTFLLIVRRGGLPMPDQQAVLRRPDSSTSAAGQRTSMRCYGPGLRSLAGRVDRHIRRLDDAISGQLPCRSTFRTILLTASPVNRPRPAGAPRPARTPAAAHPGRRLRRGSPPRGWSPPRRCWSPARGEPA